MAEDTPEIHPMVKMIAQALITAQAASAPHLAGVHTQAQDDLAQRLHGALKPLLDELIGNGLQSVDPAHIISKLWDSPDPLGPPPVLPPIDTGGILGGFENALLTIIGILGAAIGLLPQIGAIINQPFINQLKSAYPNYPIPPADLADMVERNILDEADGAAEALLSGMDGARFDLLVQDTGEPPGIQESLEMYMRGAMDLDEFTRILYYSRVRNEFLPYVLQMGFHQMSTADALELALKEVVDDATAQKYFAQAGGIADEWAPLLAAAGNPIGTEQAANLLAHGVITEARFQQVVAHSRINPEFLDLAADTHLKWLSAYQLHQAQIAGLLTAAQVQEAMIQNGYDPMQAAAFAGGGSGTKTASHKAETEAMIISEWQAKLIPDAQAESMLGALGYDTSEISLIMELAQAKLIISQRNSAVGKVRSLYLGKRITQGQASNDLDALGIAAAARDQYLQIWSTEFGSEVKEFTTAQIGAMVKSGTITDSDAEARWVAQGWSQQDATLLAETYAGKKATAKQQSGTL